MVESNIGNLKTSKLIRLFSGSFTVRITYTFLGFVNTVLLAKVLGVSSYGIYIFCFSIVSLLNMPIQFGVPTLVMREFAAYQVKNRWDLIRGLEKSSNIFIFLMSILICFFSFIFIELNSSNYSKEKYSALVASLTLVPLLSFGALRDSMLKGFRFIVLGLLSENVLRPLFLMISLAIIIFFDINIHSADLIILVFVICSVFSFFTGFIIYRLKRPNDIKGVNPNYKNRDWILAAIPIGFTTGMQVIGVQLSTISLDFFSDSSDIAIYRVAVLISGFVIIILQIINTVVAPHFSRLYVNGDLESLELLINKTLKIIIISTLPIIFIIIAFGEKTLIYFYGDEFIPSYYPLIILTLAQGVNALFGMVGLLLNMTGFQSSVTKVVFLTLILNVILHIVLVPYYGAIGAAIASFVTLSLLNFGCWRLVKNKLNIKYFI